MDLADRAAGCLLGLALGDALGAPFEFRRASEIPDPLPAFELPWMGLPPGSTTDDTALARNLARSLAERGDLDPDDLVARHLAWFRGDPPDVGSLTRRVLSRAARGIPAAAAAEQVLAERGPEASAGNGSVMYCAPLGVAFARRPGELARLAPALSGLTHADPRCRTACLAVTLAVAALVRGESPGTAVRLGLEGSGAGEGGEELEFLVGAVGGSRPVDGPDQGFCLYAAAVGLRAVLDPGGFEAALRGVVALGGDTDTNAAVAGALAGAAVGRPALPPAWVAAVRERDAIEREGTALADLAAREADPTKRPPPGGSSNPTHSGNP